MTFVPTKLPAAEFAGRLRNAMLDDKPLSGSGDEQRVTFFPRRSRDCESLVEDSGRAVKLIAVIIALIDVLHGNQISVKLSGKLRCDVDLWRIKSASRHARNARSELKLQSQRKFD